MEFGLFINITFQSVIVTVVGLLSFLIGALVYSRDINRIDNLSFFLFSWVFSIWSLLLSIFESVGQGVLEYVILYMLYLVAAVIPLAIVFFSMTLSSGGKIVFTKIKIFLITLPFILISFVIPIPGFLFESVKSSGVSVKEIVFGKGFPIFVLYILLYVVGCIVLLFIKYKKSAGIFKTEILYILLTVIFGSLVVLSANIIFPYFGFFNLFWLGPITGFFVLCVIGYLIIKYNFWNLKLAATDFFISLISLILMLELVTSLSVIDLVIKIIILVLVLVSGLFLVRSVRDEIENREKVEKLVKQLAKVNDNLHILDKQKSEFVATSAHHLRDPLTAINGYTSMVLDGSFGEVNDGVKEAVSRILESSKRLVVIIEDFMNISKIESGKMDYKFLEVDIKKMVKELVYEMSIPAKKSGLMIKLVIEKDASFVSKVDLGKLRQVLSNLIDNSIKYTPHGSIDISLSKNKEGKILIKLSDTGIGMSKETLKKIFHKFSRADEASKFHTGGSGLGLYVAKEMLKKHHGKIWAESEGVGRGSTFFIELNT